MNYRRTWGVVNAFAAAGMIAVNGLANALPMNGRTTGEVSAKFDVFFVPAGYVFSIWGLIYIGVAAFAAYQLIPGRAGGARISRIGPLFAISCAANAAWLVFWHHEMFELTVAAMAVLLLSLIFIYLRLGIGRVRVAGVEKWIVNAPFSVYLGWITVATIANVTVLLAHWEWDGWGIAPETWTYVMLAAAAAIAGAMNLSRGDTAFQLVLVWAFAGIAARQWETREVAVASLSAAGAVVAMLAAGLFIGRRPSEIAGSKPALPGSA